MTSVHAATNGWNLAIADGGRVFFDGGVSSPLEFPHSATSIVFRAFAVVECTTPLDHATLIDAPCSIRLIPDTFGDNQACFYESQLTNAVSLAIEAVPTNVFVPSASLQLVEASFEPPASLNEIYIGGAPATAAWNQGWSGGIAELVLLASEPTGEQLNAIRRYLALRHGIAVPTESDGGIVFTLTAMGLDTAGLFNAIFLVK